MSKPRLLHEVLAVFKGVKSRVASRTTEIHRLLQKPELLSGFTREYRPKDDAGERLPAESKRVQAHAEELLDELSKHTIELLDVGAALDYANCSAKSDVVIGGQVIIKDAPTTYLMFLEKQLVDTHTSLSAMLVLDEAHVWHADANQPGLYRTSPVETHRTKKVQKALTLAAATDKHPAQATLITDDVLEGYWTVTGLCGGIPEKRKKALLRRIDRLIDAVKEARERANQNEAPDVPVGRNVMDYLFSPA